MRDGTFSLFGPVAYFLSGDGTLAGVAQQRMGSLEPAVSGYADPAFGAMTAEFVKAGDGMIPLDGSLGNARKIEETSETLGEHIKKGGFMMYPIIVVALITVGYSLVKLSGLAMIWTRLPSDRKLNSLFSSLSSPESGEAEGIARSIGGPMGKMIRVGVDYRSEARDMIEEVMFEKMLEARYRLRGFVPFVAVSAAAAPLMGLLGTVLGIINTFKMLTVFGSGDVKQLSGGISEALITTEAGLVLAIPALTCHALLMWLTRGYTDKMEKTAIAILSSIEKARGQESAREKGGEKEFPEPPPSGTGVKEEVVPGSDPGEVYA